MARDVQRYCQECTKCQQATLSMPQRAPLINTPIGRAWQMIAVDILEVPLSPNNNRYLLVVQDYFTKWDEAIPLPDQTAAHITGELIKLFSIYGYPEIAETLRAFSVRKSRTTAYHPQGDGDGMVERFNRTVLQILRTYVDTQNDWECYLPLVLYAYRTLIHSATGASPFLLMYGQNPLSSSVSSSMAFDSQSYPAHLQAKLPELHDLVESNLAEAARSQKHSYDKHIHHPLIHCWRHCMAFYPNSRET